MKFPLSFCCLGAVALALSLAITGCGAHTDSQAAPQPGPAGPAAQQAGQQAAQRSAQAAAQFAARQSGQPASNHP